MDPTDEDKINIALYHGSISGCKTDVGWTMEYGENDISIFDPFDFAFLGDIHKTNQVLDEDGRIRYAGSTVQQNHGETNDKGYLIWEIENKDEWGVRHVELKNPKPFVTINLTPKGRIPKGTNVPVGSRLRLVSNNNLPLDVMRKAIDVGKTRYDPESITFLNRSAGERGNVEDMTKGMIDQDLRDITVQEELIEEYLKDYEVDEDTLENVFSLNRKYNTLAEQEEEVSRHVNWKLKSFEWDNLFNYGEGNKINFNNLNGVVGIFGKNFSGKSSIIDGLLYTLFNSTSKNERKNLNIINQNKEDCIGTLELAIGDKTYTIERTSEKYVKKLKGEETLEAKTNVNFESYCPVLDEITSLNGLTRNGTDKGIRKLLGTVDDFLFTSMASQLGSLTFINEGSTKRKEILAKFLDLEIFEKKFKMAKDDAVDLRGALKRLEGKEYEESIKQARFDLEENNIHTNRQRENCQVFEKEIEGIESQINELEEKINSIPADVIDILAVNKNIVDHENVIKNIGEINKGISTRIDFNQQMFGKIESFLKDFDIEACQEKKDVIDQKREELGNLISDLAREDEQKQRYIKKEGLLKEVPCGSEFSHCKFIKDAYAAVGLMNESNNKMSDLSVAINKKGEEIREHDYKKLDEYITKYNKVLTKKNGIATELANDQINFEKNKAELVRQNVSLQDLLAKKGEYEENKEAIENLELLLEEKDNKNSSLGGVKVQLADCNNLILDLYKQHGSLEQRLENLTSQKEELDSLREEYAAYDLFTTCMHSNGISYDIIKKKLPVINDEVSKVLANVVDFESFFESEGNKLDIFIKHPKFDPRPIEMGSGAEKTIVAMAIRLALLSISSLPKSNIFILDEPATALDEDNMEGFIRILDMVKNYYQTVLLISHVDSLKDIADMTIEIEKKNGFAFVSH
jgi:DNA repair exonuclease SbcCD ATPase subunit